MRKPEDFPDGTPIFAKCKRCKDTLPYPPIQVPNRPVAEGPGQVAVVWDKYCLKCAPRVVRRLREKSLIPEHAWFGTTKVANPYMEDR